MTHVQKKPKLTIDLLIEGAKQFCGLMSQSKHDSIIGDTDGKVIGTYIEHKFKDILSEKYVVTIGSSAQGIDFPDPEIDTDMKTTFIIQPQSSCPFENARQKIFGLGYDL